MIEVCNINGRLWMQMHIGYTVVYSVFILAKQLNVIVEFTSVTFTLLSIGNYMWAYSHNYASKLYFV